MGFKLIKNPITLKRIQRFKEMKRAYYAFWILIILYGLSLSSEFICNDRPLYVHFNGKSYFPVIKFYPQSTFTGGTTQTRTDYRRLEKLPLFKDNPDNYMIFAPIRFGPTESISPDSLLISDQVSVTFTLQPLIGTVNIDEQWIIVRSVRFENFFNQSRNDVKGRPVTEFFPIPDRIKQAVADRFSNQDASALSQIITDNQGRNIEISLSAFSQRRHSPKTVRLKVREVQKAQDRQKDRSLQLLFNRVGDILDQKISAASSEVWNSMPDSKKSILIDRVKSRFFALVDPYSVFLNGKTYMVSFFREEVRFPFKPTMGHWLGIDGAGRDVLARILYGLRTSMSFGLFLAVWSMLLGICAGALQGYFGGLLDISGQRLIEIWSALPFLYIMILMGSIFGRSFSLLLFCYGLFNWIGISYYMRAEFLRLRKQPFVEAARCMGIKWHKIIFRHILPNGLVPIITFFPFSLVGAIGSLAALDYLGFGLPPPTPSWGELLFQAQQYRWAWWLILYPSLALFIVMLLGVFVGEGVRNAYDPKQYTRLD